MGASKYLVALGVKDRVAFRQKEALKGRAREVLLTGSEQRLQQHRDLGERLLLLLLVQEKVLEARELHSGFAVAVAMHVVARVEGPNLLGREREQARREVDELAKVHGLVAVAVNLLDALRDVALGGLHVQVAQEIAHSLGIERCVDRERPR